jgi:hypothetical protein
MKRCEYSDLLREVASAPPVHRPPIDRQETVLAAPGESEKSAPPPVLPPILLKDEASFLESPPPMGAGGTKDQETVEAPAEYARRVAEMDARAVQDARGEEITKLLRRMLRLERAFCAVMPSLLLIPGLPEQRRKVLAQAIQLLRKALEEKSSPKAGAGRAAPGAPGKATR